MTVTRLRRCSRLAGAVLSLYGIALGQDLYVTSLLTNQVLKYNGSTGAFVSAFVPTGSGGLNEPVGLTFGPDGNLYVASAGSNQVLEYHGGAGAFVRAFVPTGSGGLDEPFGLTFGPDGNLYVVSAASNQVLEYNGSTGAFVSAFVPTGSGGLIGPVGLTFGPDGNLYVASAASNQVLEYNGGTGAFVSAFVPAGSGGLNGPFGLTFGPDGNLYVVSAGTYQVLEYNGSTGAFVSAFVPTGSGGLNEPFGLTFGPDGNLYVASARSNQVLEYNGGTGAFVSAFVPTGSGGLDEPVFLVFGPTASRSLRTDGPFQVRYAANLDKGESWINVINTGAQGAPALGPGFGGITGNLCVNAYVFDIGEELVACCSCPVTPNQVISWRVNADLLANTNRPFSGTSVVIKLLSTLEDSTQCNNSAALVASTTAGVPGMVAFGTTLHTTSVAGALATTETPFIPAMLSAAELASLGNRCTAIIGNLSGYGICAACRAGALGAAKRQ